MKVATFNINGIERRLENLLARALFALLVERGWTDALRTLHPAEPMYTFWHYLRKRWERDAGMRLDHLLLSPTLSGRLIAGADRTARGDPNASDHAPAWITLLAAAG